MELPSRSWLANTQEDALRGLRDLVAEVVRDLTDIGETVPAPLSSRSYSGEFNLRVGEQLHAGSPWKPPQNTSASTSTPSADSATPPEPEP